MSPSSFIGRKSAIFHSVVIGIKLDGVAAEPICCIQIWYRKGPGFEANRDGFSYLCLRKPLEGMFRVYNATTTCYPASFVE